jgi:hypothetical protein
MRWPGMFLAVPVYKVCNGDAHEYGQGEPPPVVEMRKKYFSGRWFLRLVIFRGMDPFLK